MNINNFELQILIKKVENRFGKKINFAFELEELSNHIKKNINISISVQSLRRIFGFIKDGTKPSNRTINILCTYCGYDNIIDFTEKTDLSSTPTSDIDLINIIKEFLKINPINSSDYIYQNACGNITKYILKNKNILQKTKQFITSDKIAQVYLIERHPYIDGLCNGYDEIIKLYIQEKKTNDAILFGNCLLLLSSILAEDKFNSKKYIDIINSFESIDNFHPFLQARKIACNILYNYVNENYQNLDKWINDAFKQEKLQKRFPKKEAYFPFYQFIMADVLILINKYEEADYFLKIANKDYRKIEDLPVDNEYYNCLELMDLINKSYKNGNRGLNKKIRKFNTSELVFGMHDYYSIQILIVLFQSQKYTKNKNIDVLFKTIEDYIEKTGFKFFLRKLYV